MKRAGLIALILVAFATSSVAQQSQRHLDIVQIHFIFLASRAAALGCDAVDKTTEPKFLSNSQTVTIRAMMALRERNPDLSDSDLAAKVTAAQNATEADVKNEIAKNGCASDRIKGLLELYKTNSEVSLGG